MKRLKRYLAEHGLTKTADALGVTAQRLSNWAERGVPIELCTNVEMVTGGFVRRWHLRPDDWFSIWPELVSTPGAPKVPKQKQEA